MSFVKHLFKSQRFKKHFHTNYSIGLITKGTHKLELKNQEFVARAGELKIINPFELHRADGNLSWEYINFMPEDSEIIDISQGVFDKTIQSDEIKFKNSITDRVAIELFLRVYSAKSSLEREESLAIFISYILKNFLEKPQHIPKISSSIKKSLEFISEHFLERITLDEVAKVSTLSKYHFIKIFSKEMGLTPYQYILDLRLDYAYRRLKSGYPSSIIAQETRFSDQSHFIKAFKARFGFTPSLIN